MPPCLPFLRPNVHFAFSYRHDKPIDLFRADHRSVFKTSAGIETSFGPEKIMGLFVEGNLIVIPSAIHDLLTGLVQAGVTFSLGPPRL